jgi:hypothetical protein
MKALTSKTIAIAGVFTFGMAGQIITASAQGKPENNAKPNFIVIFADDLGYGDLGISAILQLKHPTSIKWQLKDRSGRAFM